MFYLTYRPHTIATLDNTPVAEVIGNILSSEKKLPHAFLFVGGKGLGKTSTARIVAKAVNCLKNKFGGKGTSHEPCNECTNCLDIDSSSSPDVVEIDAASNTGVDNVRALIENISYAPMSGKYRIYIVDEVHMLSTSAFNALLKTLEEPPETALFILATTNEEKLPKTVVSRCVKVSFGSASPKDVVHMLERITKAEKLEVPTEVLEFVATHCDNSFRDAAKLLEELSIQHKLSLADAKEFVGARATESLVEIVSTKKLPDALTWVQAYTSRGGSIQYLLDQSLRDLHDNLLAVSGVGEENLFALKPSQVARLMKLLTESYSLLKISPIPEVPLEIALVEYYDRDTLSKS